MPARYDLAVGVPEELEPEPGGEVAAARQGIQSVELAMLVLQALEEGLGPLSLTQVAAAAGMTPSKAHRYLVSLGRVGLVAQSHRSGLYDLGPAMRRLGIESLRRMDEVGLASEHTPGLRDRTTHAVNLAVWGDHGPVLVRWDYGAHPLPITVRLGATMPLLSSSVGRVYLAHLPDTVTGPALEAQLAPEPVTGRIREEIARVRAEVRDRGVALTSGGLIPGLASIAAPVFGADDSLPLVVAIALPARLADPAVLERLQDELLRTTADMAVDLGAADRPGKARTAARGR
ncbi:IclR family transcriptional regulator [Pseudonocardia sp. WMMC193]|uniref:IclR family transcriptional regulator n=1 Tax=Pseudonocardia sp. WMMC193 TaxID=2911965 RepID=UPI001F1ED523|nr:IclR family transcriptional regulator [Pseudonocardia sp. WMMC193]MCF7553626.1 IclR family transcriptional regulator [Pseudonocardia sp. WMMC193]